ncbi:MAG: Gfo/Idh/MocA family protein [Actinomycetes bacterium]
MNPTPVNIGIVGGGLMGREVAAALQRWPALVDHPVRPRLTAVCDINPAVLGWFDQIPTVTRTVTDYADLLADDTINVLYIAVRHDLHAQLYVDTITAGKSLLAEKPFGIDLAAAEAVAAAAAQHPESFVRCSSEMPFFPGAQAAINYVRSGALGRIVQARCGFLHASDLDVAKPINWKRQVRYCGEAGVMNDLGMHAWHVPLRLGWQPDRLFGVLQNIVPERPTLDGGRAPCDTWDNAALHSWVGADGYEFPLVTEMKRIAPGEKNTWEFAAQGMDGGVRFSTKNPKRVDVFSVVDVPGGGREQVWSTLDAGSQSVWPTVTGPNFESGFSDTILQMWAAFLAERERALGDRFGCATVEEAVLTHRIYAAAIRSHQTGTVERLAG